MMKSKKVKYAVFIFSFLLILMAFPIGVFAANELTKDLDVTVETQDEAEKKAEKYFEKSIIQDGKEYKLTGIDYTLLNTKYLEKKEKKMEVKEKPKKTWTENGVEYSLKTSEKRERILSEKAEQLVTAYDDYDHEVSQNDVPGMKTVNALNQITGLQEDVSLKLNGISPAGLTTIENIMTITFTDYDSAYYEWNGQYIPKNDEIPPLAGYEDSLLQSVGASEGSEIIEYHWNNEPYVKDGITYRDAVATVRQQVEMYRADYVGYIVTPEKKETFYEVVYETPDKHGKKILSIKAEATYEEVRKSPLPYIIAVGAGIVVLAGLIVMILIILSKKRKEEK